MLHNWSAKFINSHEMALPTECAHTVYMYTCIMHEYYTLWFVGSKDVHVNVHVKVHTVYVYW